MWFVGHDSTMPLPHSLCLVYSSWHMLQPCSHWLSLEGAAMIRCQMFTSAIWLPVKMWHSKGCTLHYFLLAHALCIIYYWLLHSALVLTRTVCFLKLRPARPEHSPASYPDRPEVKPVNQAKIQTSQPGQNSNQSARSKSSPAQKPASLHSNKKQKVFFFYE